MTVALTGRDLALEEVVRVARGGEPVELAPEALGRMRATRRVLEGALARGDEVYGVTTGVGAKKSAHVGGGDASAREWLLVRNHRVGQGPPLPQDVVRAAMLRLANGLASGAAGARPDLVDAVVRALNAGVLPTVRTYGSIGEADLSANADLAHGILGGFELAAGEGLALLSGNGVSTGHAALAVVDACVLLDSLDVAGALDLEGFAANVSALDRAIGDARPYPGLRETLERLGALLAGSFVCEPGAGRNLQDPLSFRCLPQVHGVARDALRFATAQLAVELNAAQGNPLVMPLDGGGGGRIASVGNFDALAPAVALDHLRIALAPALTSAAERTVKLLQRPLSGLPEGLAARPGLHEDGLAELGIAVQALVAEARLLAQPVSFELVSTTQAEGIEDRMTMAPLAARRLAQMTELGMRAVAVELVVAAQAVDLRGHPALGAGTARAYGYVRERVPATGEGDPVPQDLEPVVELVRSGRLG